jgi:hypothetical protein
MAEAVVAVRATAVANALATIGRDGHMLTGHRPHSGTGALQIARPCRMSQ